ncbi:ribonuclease BN [Elizabethkingia argentiflava]|uniref:Ribonuclease BN n=1 Tax=Elizabethkingia argenteiflava TaxID=2681556 RepID=A0A845PXP3_9FLAO|nr:YihY/virulence factor BrkB family protein [Elizabethkingia argenteiflava]NAW51118.1 ribonuclease BN [Elizabethkingia argenteiflava]
MYRKIKFLIETLKQAGVEWNKSSASKDSASLAYYAIFSIPGFLVIIIWVVGYFFGEEATRGELSLQVSDMMGVEAAKSIENIIANASIDKQNIFMKIVGVASLIFGSTTLFFQLQHSLNALWRVKASPKKAFIKFLLDRINSLGMILIIGFLFMITMLLSSLVSLLNAWITQYFGLGTYILVQAINFIFGFGLVFILFSLIFKMLPDIQIGWKPVFNGAFLTTVLFTFGKILLSIYFNKFKPTSTFGAAGTVVLIMMWINYSCMIMFFGAQFIRVYILKKGYSVTPSKHASWSDDVIN